MTVGELGERMTGNELACWRMLGEPLGLQRVDYLIAMLASLFYAAHRGRGAPPKSLQEFLLFPRRSAVAKEWDWTSFRDWARSVAERPQTGVAGVAGVAGGGG